LRCGGGFLRRRHGAGRRAGNAAVAAGSDPRQPATRSAAPNSQGSATGAAIRL